MFANKPYMAVNREERFYCALLFHALLASGKFRARFCELVSTKIDGFDLKPDGMQVYLEAAILRDYWADLSADDKLKMLVKFGVISDKSELEKYSFLRTKRADDNGVITSPGRWSIERIIATNFDVKFKEQLIKLKWAFNAKPDIMIISGDNVIIFEAKVESGEDVYTTRKIDKWEKFTQRQTEVQQYICELLEDFVPVFNKRPVLAKITPSISTKKLELDRVYHFEWKEIIALCDESLVDEFTLMGMKRLAGLCYPLAKSALD